MPSKCNAISFVNQNVANRWSRIYCACPWEYSGEDSTRGPCPDGDFYSLVEKTDIEGINLNNLGTTRKQSALKKKNTGCF